VTTKRYTNEEIRKRKGNVDHAKVNAATKEQIAAWKREDGIDDANGAPQVLSSQRIERIGGKLQSNYKQCKQ
jgi:hypothetical protein